MLLPMLPLLRHAIFAIRSLPSRGRSPASGSRNHRAALYCRQTDSAAAEASAVENYSVAGNLQFTCTLGLP